MKDEKKAKIIDALEDNRKRILNIEIQRSEHMENRWNMRIGDIIGSTEFSNFDIKKILKEIESEMLSLRK